MHRINPVVLSRNIFTDKQSVRKNIIDIRPLCDNADPFIFCGWSKNLQEWTSSRSKAPPKRCLQWFSIPPPSQDCSFPLAWPGSGAPLSRYLEGALYTF